MWLGAGPALYSLCTCRGQLRHAARVGAGAASPCSDQGRAGPGLRGLNCASCLQVLASAGDTACRAGEGDEGEVVYRASPSQRAAAAAQPGQAREGLDTARQRLISAVQRARDAQSAGPAGAASPVEAAARDGAEHALARRAAPSTAASAGPLLRPRLP